MALRTARPAVRMGGSGWLYVRVAYVSVVQPAIANSQSGAMIVVLGLSHHTAPVTLRERFAIVEARIPATLQLLRDSGLADEAVILSTCNRVEIYASVSTDAPTAFRSLRGFLISCADYRDPITDEMYTLAEPQSIEHLFKVASGLDSMVLGETEILGQIKKAYE